MAKTNQMQYPNDLLKAFVANNVGRIEAVRSSSSDLQAFLNATRLA